MNTSSYIVIFALIFSCAVLFLYETTWNKESFSTLSLKNIIQTAVKNSKNIEANFNQNSSQELCQELLQINSPCNCDKYSKLDPGNALKVLTLRNKSREAFYFIETSQLGILKPRQICALESTAKIHPNADVYLLILQPSVQAIELNMNYALELALRHYRNIQVLSLQMREYFQGSILEDWYLSGKLNNSAYPLHHKSDVLRIFTLYKYGGTYLDLDFVTRKSLSKFKNFLCSESSVTIANGGLGFEKNHPLTVKFVEEIRNTFDGSQWSHNGPEMITRVMTQHCGVAVDKMNEQTCHGVTFLSPNMFYPIPYQSWQRYFQERNSMKTMEELKNSPAVHVWNKLSEGGVISIGSQQPYGLLAKEFCPRTYWSCDSKF